MLLPHSLYTPYRILYSYIQIRSLMAWAPTHECVILSRQEDRILMPPRYNFGVTHGLGYNRKTINNLLGISCGKWSEIMTDIEVRKNSIKHSNRIDYLLLNTIYAVVTYAVNIVILRNLNDVEYLFIIVQVNAKNVVNLKFIYHFYHTFRTMIWEI